MQKEHAKCALVLGRIVLHAFSKRALCTYMRLRCRGELFVAKSAFNRLSGRKAHFCFLAPHFRRKSRLRKLNPCKRRFYTLSCSLPLFCGFFLELAACKRTVLTPIYSLPPFPDTYRAVCKRTHDGSASLPLFCGAYNQSGNFS